MSKKVALSPEQAVSLAAQHLNEGNATEAKCICEMVVNADPNHAAALNLLGTISLKAGDIDGAIKLFEKIIKVNPEDEISWVNLVQCHIQLEDYQKAIELVQARLKDKPDDIKTLALLEQTSSNMGRYDIAHKTLQKLLELKPESNTVIKLEIAALFIKMNFPGQAKKWIEEVLKAEPKNKAALWIYGEMLKQSGLVEKAIGYFEAACVGQETSQQNKLSLANTYADLNRTSDAIALISEIFASDPNCVPAYMQASHLQEGGLTDDQISRLKEIQQTSPDVPQREECIEYAFAQTAEARGEHIKAFKHYRKANKLHKTSLDKQKKNYDRKFVENKFIRIKQVFTPELISRLSVFGNPSTVPVFIVGMPRSGTTLTERIIGNHSKATGVGELMDLPHLAILIRELSKSKKNYPNCLLDLDEKYISNLAEGYLKRIQDWEPQAERIVNKLPGNYMFIGLIRILFPNAAIIHCLRDPRDTLISCFFARFNHGLNFSFDLDDCAHQYELYKDMMAYWNTLFPNDIYASLYSDLVSQPEQAITNILAHCGLEWEEECLNFHNSPKAVRTASRMQVRKPIYTSSIDRWKRYEGQIDEIQHLRLT